MPHSLLKWLRKRSQCKDGRSRLAATVRGLASIENKKLPTLLNETLHVRMLIFSAQGSKRKSKPCANAEGVTPSSKNSAVNKHRGKQGHRQVKCFAQSHIPGHWQSLKHSESPDYHLVQKHSSMRIPKTVSKSNSSLAE